jgi:hypothetical protein
MQYYFLFSNNSILLVRKDIDVNELEDYPNIHLDTK